LADAIARLNRDGEGAAPRRGRPGIERIAFVHGGETTLQPPPVAALAFTHGPTIDANWIGETRSPANFRAPS
jgi:hypothetical protein